MTSKSATATLQRGPLTRAEKDELTSDLRIACMVIARRVRFESTSEVAPHQYSVLLRLKDRPRTPREVADIERVSAPSMSRTVASLVDLGLVERSDDPEDGRQVILSLTDAGRNVIRDTRRRRDQWLAVRLEKLGDDERALLREATALLEKVAAE
jgi:DNA-binding MarR family transcriptional regulator